MKQAIGVRTYLRGNGYFFSKQLGGTYYMDRWHSKYNLTDNNIEYSAY